MNQGKIIGAIVSGVLIAGLVIGGLTCTTRVKNGYVAVQYSINGGIKEEVLTQGWHLVTPDIKTTQYSIATETFVMSQDKRAGSEEDDSFKVTCSDGEINVDFEMQYSFNPNDVVEVFKKYRGTEGKLVVSDMLRSRIKTVVNEVMSEYSVLEAHLEKKAEVNKVLTDRLRDVLKDYGVSVESATLPATRVSDTIQKSIEERTRKSQELEAEKLNQEKVRLEAESKRIKAEGDKTARILEAQAEAEANQLINNSVTDNLLKKMEMEARIKHGWVEINGANTVVTENK